MNTLIETGLIVTRAHPADAKGTQYVYRFANNYGASVIRFFGSYGTELGLYELAVLKFDGDNWQLTYDTPITDDVIGSLSIADVNDVLKQIESLEAV